ncbi:hypothetical protein MSSIH_0590 [Methanosarcina siciliae HI350]|uniref:Uncharacterized protein n=1 Tax=Methanosarcina siciliae HI350 TaxID=1434119 RepID=A0A0E3PAV1_9EURY|nr:hypothetical protein MSSIH_0590 [Methanosarcina siciliae HI350]
MTSPYFYLKISSYLYMKTPPYFYLKISSYFYMKTPPYFYLKIYFYHCLMYFFLFPGSLEPPIKKETASESILLNEH